MRQPLPLGHTHPTLDPTRWKGWTGRPNKQIDNDHAEWHDHQPVVTRCAHCPFVHEGTAAEGRQAAHEHRLKAHPELTVRRRRRRRVAGAPIEKGWAATRDQDKAEAMVEVEKRRRQIGAA